MIGIAALWANPLVRKITIYGAIGLGAAWAFKVFWLNPHDNKIEMKARQSMAEELEATKRAEWEAKEEAIRASADEVEREKLSLESQRQLLAAERANIARTLRAGLERIQNERIRDVEDISNVPDVGLWDAIREISNQLTTVDNRGTPPSIDPTL